MRKTGILILLALAFGTSAEARFRSMAEIKRMKVLRVAVDGATPPFNYFKGKELVGFEVDLAKEIANRMGLKVEWVVQPFNSLIIGVNQDRFDLIATSHAITPARMEAVYFIEPHYCTGAIIVSKEGGPKTVRQLAGKVAAVPVGTVYYERLKGIAGIKEIKTVPKETDGLQALVSGRADAWITDQFVAAAAMKANPNFGLGTGEVLLSQKNAMVVAKGNIDLRDEVNAILKKMMNDGAYERADRAYFDRDIRCQ